MKLMPLFAFRNDVFSSPVAGSMKSFLDAVRLIWKEHSGPQVHTQPPHAKQVANVNHDVERAADLFAELGVILVHQGSDRRAANAVGQPGQPLAVIDQIYKHIGYRTKTNTGCDDV
jgi:hypothetical protein